MADPRYISDKAIVIKVPLDRLKPLFVREVSSEGLEELAQSIKFTGILQPIVVRSKDYGIIAGYRRYLAAKLAGLTNVPCILVDCDDSEALRLCLVENLQREDLSDYELAKRLKEFKEKTGFTDEQIAQLVGKSRVWVTNHLRILELEKLSNVSRETLEKLTEYHARAILAQPEEVQGAIIGEVEKAIAERGEAPSVREIERKAKELLKPSKKELPQGNLELEGKTESCEYIVEKEEEALGADRIFELKALEDVDRFFDEILKAQEALVETREESEYPCPCDCGWSIRIDWRNKRVEWVAP